MPACIALLHVMVEEEPPIDAEDNQLDRGIVIDSLNNGRRLGTSELTVCTAWMMVNNDSTDRRLQVLHPNVKAVY